MQFLLTFINPNSAQFGSYVRSALKFLAAALVAHGHSTAGGWLNDQALAGYVVGLLSLLFSHMTHSEDTNPGGNAKTGAAVLLLALLLPCFIFTGCVTDQATLAYKAESAAAVTIDAAMNAWADYVAKFHPPASQELAVKTAYLKYQAVELLAIDATTALAQTHDTNQVAPMTNYAALAASALADLVSLLRQFGVKI